MRLLIFSFGLMLSTCLFAAEFKRLENLTDLELFVAQLNLKADYATFVISAIQGGSQAVIAKVNQQNFDTATAWIEVYDNQKKKILVASIVNVDGGGRIIGIYEIKQGSWDKCTIGLITDELFQDISEHGFLSYCEPDAW